MRSFAIDNDNTITAFPAAEQIPEGQEHFASEKELAKLAANWPAGRLVQTWNSFAGVAGFGGDLKPVKKFTDRKSAVARIWKAIQKLDDADAATSQEPATTAPPAADVAPQAANAAQTARTKARTPKVAKPAKAKASSIKAAKPATEAREGSKKAIVLELLRRKDGATLAEIAKATDWQNHSIRGFISGTITKKMGLNVESTRVEGGERTYRVTD